MLRYRTNRCNPFLAEPNISAKNDPLSTLGICFNKSELLFLFSSFISLLSNKKIVFTFFSVRNNSWNQTDWNCLFWIRKNEKTKKSFICQEVKSDIFMWPKQDCIQDVSYFFLHKNTLFKWLLYTIWNFISMTFKYNFKLYLNDY